MKNEDKIEQNFENIKKIFTELTNVASQNVHENRRRNFWKEFKNLNAENRNDFAIFIADLCLNLNTHNKSLDYILHVWLIAIATERDWETLLCFIQNLIKSYSKTEIMQDIIISLLNIADNELNIEKRKYPLGQTALVMLTEIGLSLAKMTISSRLDPKVRLIEYISTNLLARSNVNNNAMRIALVHFLSNTQLNSSSSQQLMKVISRFGQSLLESVLNSFFTDKQNSEVAFYFLTEHLHVFINTSLALSEMTHEVLRHAMFKHPEEFPIFLESYCSSIPNDQIKMKALIKHLTMLMCAAVEISKKQLTDNLKDILLTNLEKFYSISQNLYNEQATIILRILQSYTPVIKSSSYSVIIQCINDIKNIGKQTQDIGIDKNVMTSVKSNNKIKNKIFKLSSSPSPLDVMLALAG